MQYMNIKDASTKWGISERRIRILCSEGRVDGAQRSGWAWNIPINAPKPGDGRRLRHLKNFDMRVGAQNYTKLDQALSLFHQTCENTSDDVLQQAWSHVFSSFITSLLEDEGLPVDARDVMSIYDGKLVEALPLDVHLLVVNCKCVLRSMLRSCTDAVGSYWSEQDLRSLHASLLHGIEDVGCGQYRDAHIPAGGAWSGDQRTFSVSQQMETLFVQYDREWSMLHPLVRSVFLFGELVRIKPFERCSTIIAWLVLAGELLANGGYPPPVIDDTRLSEFKATLALTVKRGNYQGTARMIEESIQRELASMIKFCLQ